MLAKTTQTLIPFMVARGDHIRDATRAVMQKYPAISTPEELFQFYKS